jgi:hypothetical protein
VVLKKFEAEDFAASVLLDRYAVIGYYHCALCDLWLNRSAEKPVNSNPCEMRTSCEIRKLHHLT